MKAIKSEDELLALIDNIFPSQNDAVYFGRGSDCAEFSASSSLSISTDLFLEDIHFRRSYFTLREIGYKALACNVSDMAASGSKPEAFSLGLMLPKNFSIEEAKEVFEGMSSLSEKYGIILAGGDIAKNPSGLGFSISIWGSAPKPDSSQEASFLRRAAAKAGDKIFFVHPQKLAGFGLAKAGLYALEKYGRAAILDYPASCIAHLEPTPMVEQGLAINTLRQGKDKDDFRFGMMDVSDGLARDLPRLIGASQNRLGANVSLGTDTLHPELLKLACTIVEENAQNGTPASIALGMALSGGEEYGLLGTCPESALKALSTAIPELAVLGEVIEKNVFLCNGIPVNKLITGNGFDHFS